MVLSENLFRWFYSSSGFPSRVHLANISGGTDIAGCFAIDNPLTPVYVGGCQGWSLGVKVEVWDSTLEGGKGKDGKVMKGRRLEKAGEPGELVATRAFPNMPVAFWPLGQEGMGKYRAAYFERYVMSIPGRRLADCV
jgi:acetoacetyl-CoA synthetase